MRSLKLSGLIRRNPDRPSLKARAAALKATAARVIRRKSAPHPGTSDPARAAIEAHRSAFAAWDQLASIYNELPVGSPEFVAARAKAVEPGKRETAAFEALLSTPATTVESLRLLIDYLPTATRRVSPDIADSDEQRALDLIRASFHGLERMQQLISKPRSVVKLPPVADLLSDGILRQWAAQAALPHDEAPESEAINERALDRRHRLIAAAERLPARRESLTAKTLALAWISCADLWRRGWERDDYTTDGRLALDIDAIITGGEILPAHADAELLRLGDELVVAWTDEIDPTHNEARFEAATARSSAIVDAIEALTPATLDGVIVKAVAVSWCHCGEPLVGTSFDEQPTTDMDLCAAIVRDLLGMRVGPPLPQPKGA